MAKRTWLWPLLACAACSGGAEPPAAPSVVTPVAAAPAAPAPTARAFSIEAHDTAGVMQWLAAQKGRPLLVNCWATWCAPCIGEMPDLIASTRAFRDRGGVVVGVAMEQLGSELTTEQALAKVTAKSKALGIDFPVLLCTDDEMPKIRKAFGVEIGGLPQTLTYDRAGVLVKQHEGPAEPEEFVELARGAER